MTDISKEKRLKHWAPATYRIEVDGNLPESWTHRLAGMHITPYKRPDDSMVTTLIGRQRDQAELSGVLNSLYAMHLSVLKVQILSEDE